MLKSLCMNTRSSDKGYRRRVSRCLILPFVIILFCTFRLPATVCTYAQDDVPVSVESRTRVYDYASLFSVSDALILQDNLQKASEQISADLVVLTFSWNISQSQKAYAKEYLLDNDFGVGSGRESIIFMIDMYERMYTVFEYNDKASGYLLTDDEIDLILDDCRGSMKSGRYAAAAEKFIKSAVYYAGVDVGRNYAEGSGNLRSRLSPLQMWLISAVAACIIAAIITALMIFLRNHDEVVSASVYSKEPLKILRKIDRFTHTTMVVHHYESNSGRGGHGGSSGGTSGGGHGGSSRF